MRMQGYAGYAGLPILSAYAREKNCVEGGRVSKPCIPCITLHRDDKKATWKA